MLDFILPLVTSHQSQAEFKMSTCIAPWVISVVHVIENLSLED